MEVFILENYEEVSKKAFEVMHEVVSTKPNAVLGLATGSSPIGLYELMIADHKANGTSYKDITTFNLDEYVGLPKTHEQSYYTFMHENLFHGLDINLEHVNIPVGHADNQEAECAAYEAALSDVHVDIQVLGIGSNGHIGFNEPGTPFAQETHIIELQEKTLQDNARFFEDDINKVPTHAITMGIATIMKANKILLVACGEGKADAIAQMISGPVNENMPASILQRHKDVVVIVDKAAASKL
ncbi:MAG: glucosamine-6-phosphate deaminase [Erysipelotrichaceae bacterium]